MTAPRFVYEDWAFDRTIGAGIEAEQPDAAALDDLRRLLNRPLSAADLHLARTCWREQLQARAQP